MTLRRWTRITTTVVHENPWWRYRKDTFEIEPGKRGEYHYASTPGSALVVPVTAEGKLLLVEQYRYLADRFSLEFPCGGVAEGESPASAASRELTEESGYIGVLEPIGSFNPWNGVTDETCHVYRGQQLTRSKAAVHADETESFLVHELDIATFEARIADGSVWDGMTLAAYALHRVRCSG